MQNIDLQTVARALSGEISGGQVLAPGPGHSAKDRSLAVRLDAAAPDGFLVHSFAGDDPVACRDHVRERLGLPAFKPNGGGRRRASPEDVERLLQRAVMQPTTPARLNIIATYDYTDANGELLYQVLRLEPKDFRQRRPDGNGGWIWKLDGRRVLYRWPEILKYPDATVFVTEGERDADRVAALGQCATTVAAGKWTDECVKVLAGRDVVILEDNDEAGRKKALVAAQALYGTAKTIRVVVLPDLPDKGDVSDWLDADPRRASKLGDVCFDAPEWAPVTDGLDVTESVNGGDLDVAEGVTLDDFCSYMPAHSYIFTPSRELWPASSVNARVPPVQTASRPTSASAWLDKNSAVEQMTWCPGLPMLIHDRLISDGGWIRRKGVTCFNLYRPPTLEHGDAAKADPWLAHIDKVFGTDAHHILNWLAHRMQRPADKINHALVLGGAQGIGKDTSLEPVKQAIGPWNFSEVSPQHMLGRFNGFLKSVILRVSEARDLGDINRYQFYDHMKAYTAAPPDMLRVDEKNLREYNVLNCCGVIITTNHKADGIYLPPDDRRHYVAWSELDSSSFPDGYWLRLWGWYANGGDRHVAAYLAVRDLSTFDAKAPPPKTAAFWDIVDAGRAPEDAEMADLIDAIDNPDAITLERVKNRAVGDFADWIKDRKNRRIIPHRLEKCGYVPVRNDTARDGLWKIEEKRQVIYARSTLSVADRLRAARKLVSGHEG